MCRLWIPITWTYIEKPLEPIISVIRSLRHCYVTLILKKGSKAKYVTTRILQCVIFYRLATDIKYFDPVINTKKLCSFSRNALRFFKNLLYKFTYPDILRSVATLIMAAIVRQNYMTNIFYRRKHYM